MILNKSTVAQRNEFNPNLTNPMTSPEAAIEEYCIKKEESIEYLDDVKKELVSNSEQIVFENETAKAKCGDVIVGHQGEFTFICALCQQNFIDLRSFGTHIRDFHLRQNAPNVAFNNKNRESGPLCEAKISVSVSTQQEVGKSPPLESSATNPIQEELEIVILDSDAYSNCDDNEISEDKVSGSDGLTPLVISSDSTKVGEFVCTICRRSYQAMSSYKRHMRKRHPEGMPEQFICKYCDKEFDDMVQLETHIRTHTGKRRFVCRFCPKVFDSKLNRDSHINTHTGERPYKCSRCQKSFAHPINNKKHKCFSDNGLATVSAGKDRSDGLQREIKPETPSLVPTIGTNAIQNELEFVNFDAAASADCNENDLRDDVPCCEKSIPAPIVSNSTKGAEFVCPLCERSYQAISSYRRHMKNRHPNGVPDQIICKYCDKEFGDLVQLEKHVRTHTGKTRFVCSFCPKTFKNRRNRQIHINTHTGERPYKCPYCPKTFAYRVNYWKHKRLKKHCHNTLTSGTKPIQNAGTAASIDCNDNEGLKDGVSSCEENTSVPTLSTSAEKEKIVCMYCGRRYQSELSFKRHLKTMHVDGKGDAKQVPDQMNCMYCDEEFDDAAQFNKHVATHTGRRRFVCPFCSKVFGNRNARQFHINSHTGDRPYKCSLCPKAFAHPTNLDMHKRTHLNIKKFSCRYCSKRFVQSHEKKVHEIRHTGEKPFQCEECGKRFILHVNLKEHMKRHKNIKPSVCTVCNKAFYNLTLLKNHMPIHTNERPYHCNICGRSFPRQKSLRSHLQLHSNERKYVCNICGEAFLQSTGLYSHRKSHGEKF